MGQLLSENEAAVLTLLAMQPVTCFPPRPYMWARRLRREGLVVQRDGAWIATSKGLRHLGISTN
jgi:hypothetical protein